MDSRLWASCFGRERAINVKKVTRVIFWFGRFSYVLLLFPLRVVRSEFSDKESGALAKSFCLADSWLWASCCARERSRNVRKVTGLSSGLLLFTLGGAVNDSARALGRGIQSSSLELLFARFSALGELLRPRTKHKRKKSD